MTVHAVLLDPPHERVLPDLVETSPLSPAEAADLYAAMARDVLHAIEGSGGNLLVNYRAAEDLPIEDVDPEAAVRSLAREALDDPGEARFEVQVGSTYAARAGNTATHLLREEDVDSVAIVDPRTPTLARTTLDGAAMKLRRNATVLGPAPGGRVYYLGLAEPIDFEGAFAAPEVRTLARRGAESGVDFVETHPVVTTAGDLATVLATIEARRIADRPIPGHTAEVLDEIGLEVVEEGGERVVERS